MRFLISALLIANLCAYAPLARAQVEAYGNPTTTVIRRPSLPDCGSNMPCDSTTLPPLIDVLDCPGSDLGARINQCLSTYGTRGAFRIPEGIYDFSTPIVIAQTGPQQSQESMSLSCASRATVLNFTGTGSAITVSSTALGQQVVISNCTLDGANGSSESNGIYLHDTQNTLLYNMVISDFANVNVLGVGSISTRIESTDILRGGVNVEWQNDAANGIGSTGNRIHAGTLQYASRTNFWDQGESTPNSGDSGNIIDGVTMEEHPPAPNAIIEGTWDDEIINSYVECLHTGGSTNYFSVIVGNAPGSGYGSQTKQTASMFNFSNNYVGTCQPGPGAISATLDIINSIGLNVSGIRDAGYEVYGFVFAAGGSNTKTVIGPTNIGWGNALYLNPPPDAVLYQDPGQPLTPSEWQTSANGFMFGAVNGLTVNATNAYQFNGSPVTINRTVVHANFSGSPMPENSFFDWYVNDATTTVSIPSGCSNSTAVAYSHPAAPVTIQIATCSGAGLTKCNTVGTIGFEAGAATGTFTCPAGFNVGPNAGLVFISPTTGDVSFGNLAIALYGTHN